jgi:transposase
MSKSSEKLQAIKLRRLGWSVKDIAKELKVSRSSASVWCQEILLTASQKENLKAKQIAAGHIGRQKGAEANRAKRVRALDDAQRLAEIEIKQINNQNLFYLGLGIYWGEGIKSRSGPAAIVNSDARILRIMMRWLDECFGIDSAQLRPYVYISSAHADREKIIMSYWEKILGIPKSQFKSPIYLKRQPRQQYENHNSYYGVVALRVSKSTNLKYRILALLDTVSKRLD